MQAEPHNPVTQMDNIKTQVQNNTSQIQANTSEIAQGSHIDLTPIEYAFFGVVLLLGAGIIGWFIKNSFKSLTDSNKELKNSIENLATLVATIHTDLMEYKAEVAENYATKKDLLILKKDIKDNCLLKHEYIQEHGRNKYIGKGRRKEDTDEFEII